MAIKPSSKIDDILTEFKNALIQIDANVDRDLESISQRYQNKDQTVAAIASQGIFAKILGGKLNDKNLSLAIEDLDSAKITHAETFAKMTELEATASEAIINETLSTVENDKRKSLLNQIGSINDELATLFELQEDQSAAITLLNKAIKTIGDAKDVEMVDLFTSNAAISAVSSMTNSDAINDAKAAQAAFNALAEKVGNVSNNEELKNDYNLPDLAVDVITDSALLGAITSAYSLEALSKVHEKLTGMRNEMVDIGSRLETEYSRKSHQSIALNEAHDALIFDARNLATQHIRKAIESVNLDINRSNAAISEDQLSNRLARFREKVNIDLPRRSPNLT